MASFSEEDSTLMEFSVRMRTPSEAESVRSSLEGLEGVGSVSVDLSQESVLVRSALSSFRVQQLIEATGFLVVLRGLSKSPLESPLETPLESGVAAMQCGQKTAGLARLVQGGGGCQVEGALSGLGEGEHSLQVHEKGDLTRGWESCGEVFGRVPHSDEARGYLGRFTVGPDGTANFNFSTNQFKVSDVIGRSMVTTPVLTGMRTCGVVARSSGVFGNRKKVCECSGKTIWEEAVQAKEERIKSSL